MSKVDKLENRMDHPAPVKTILLVEDEAIIAVKEENILAKNRFKVKAVYTAEAAIQAVKTGEIDLVLMDIDLGEGMMVKVKGITRCPHPCNPADDPRHVSFYVIEIFPAHI